MQFEIVEAVDEDVITCAEMMADTDPWKTFKYSLQECIPKVSKAKWLKLAKQDDKIIGFISYEPNGIGSMSAISLLCIAEGYTGQGIGTKLLKHVEEHVFSYDKNLVFFVTSFNTGAIKFYERHGYSRVGEIENYNIPGHSEYLYRKTTGPRREK